MTKLVYLIDCDGVLRDFTGKLTEVYNREHPDKKVSPEFKSYILGDNFPIGNEIYPFFKDVHAEEIFTQAALYPGAREFLRRLNNNSIVHIVTKQPSEKAVKYTKYWFEKHRLEFQGELKFVDDKSTVKGSYLLDDDPRNLEKVLKEKSSFPVCFDKPYNQGWVGSRVFGYKGFFRILEMHKKLLFLNPKIIIPIK